MIKMKNVLAGIGLIAITLVSIQAVQDAPKQQKKVQDSPEKNNFKDKLVNDYNVYAIPMQDDLEFAGEKVPLENPDIKERMDRELLVNTYWQSNGLLLIKRAHKYFPLIEPILKEEGVPEDFKYLAVIESGLTQAVSPARATGFWQLMSGTAKDGGLEVNDNVDERYHIEMATRVACDYLKHSKEELGSWTLAAAAYNAGLAGINRRLREQDVNDYYDLLLGEETGRYMFRVIALKEILKDPQKFGFNYRPQDMYASVPTYEVRVDTAVTDFVKFAQKFDINYKILKIHNPWLREDHLNNKSRKEYFIKIPKEGSYTYSVGN